jgi:hypothetical protein
VLAFASHEPYSISFAPSQSSDNRAENFPDSGGESHRQCAPECHAGGGAQNVCTACSCPNRSQKSEKAQRRSRHDEDQRTGRRYDNHEQGHGRTYRKRCGRCQSGLHRTRGGDFRNPKLIARVGGQGIFRHQLLGNLLRKVLIDTTLDVDVSKLIKLKLRILTQLLWGR